MNPGICQHCIKAHRNRQTDKRTVRPMPKFICEHSNKGRRNRQTDRQMLEFICQHYIKGPQTDRQTDRQFTYCDANNPICFCLSCLVRCCRESSEPPQLWARVCKQLETVQLTFAALQAEGGWPAALVWRSAVAECSPSLAAVAKCLLHDSPGRPAPRKWVQAY